MYVITGGGSGIGRALAQSLINRQQSVLVVGRRLEALQETKLQAPAIEYCVADVSTSQGHEVIFQALKSRPIQGLIHNAGIIEPIMSIESIQLADWRQLMATNIDAPLFLTQRLLPLLQGGRVLNMSSGAAHFPIAGWAPYCVSKAALYQLTRCWQLESKSTSFASVMPGIIDTAMQAAIRCSTHMDDEKKAFFKNLYDEKKLLTPDCVAAFLTWLLLDIDETYFSSTEWDIYDATHHNNWLKAPHQVPHWE